MVIFNLFTTNHKIYTAVTINYIVSILVNEFRIMKIIQYTRITHRKELISNTALSMKLRQ